MLSALHNVGVGGNIEASCRAATSLTMCPANEVDRSDPTTWNKHCALGTCSQCPKLQVDVQMGVNQDRDFTFQEWKKGGLNNARCTMQLNEIQYHVISGGSNKPGKDGEERIVYSLLDTQMSIREGITLLEERTLTLKKHIFLAYHMWQHKRVAQENIGEDTLMLVSDYQQNLSIELGNWL